MSSESISPIAGDQTGKKLRPSDFLVISHPDCVGHCIPDHPEQPDRAVFILDALLELFDEGIFKEASIARDEDIKLYHTATHVEQVREVFMSAGGIWDEESALHSKPYPQAFVGIDGDTRAMKGTGKAAYRAAGAAVDAVKFLFADESSVKTVFCCVRPPGHHATRSRSMGFCFYNNAAIAAKYAQHYFNVGKVAVLDFDVHHGNGTEEGFIPFESLFYGSTHEKDNYPGTGVDPTPFVADKAKSELDRRIVNRTLKARNFLGRECSVREEFRVKWQQIINEMERFQPDFVIFSAGFDAHDEDPLANCDLLEEDFKWATEIVLDACYRLSPDKGIPIMSILEGGYDIAALTGSAVAHVLALVAGSQVKRKQSRKAMQQPVESRLPEPGLKVNDRDGSLIAAISDLLAECDDVHGKAVDIVRNSSACLNESAKSTSRAAVTDGDIFQAQEHQSHENDGENNINKIAEDFDDLEIADAVLEALAATE